MLNVDIERRKIMEQFVRECDLETVEEVARLFEEYTLLIWDYFLIGMINDFYTDDIVLNRAGGVTEQGLAKVFSNTLSSLAATPADNINVFMDIFAEKKPDGSYQFCQTCADFSSQSFGGRSYQEMNPEGQVYHDEGVNHISMCECLVKKVDGHWRIVQEWLVGTPKRGKAV